MTYAGSFLLIMLFAGGCPMTNVQSNHNSENQKVFFVLADSKKVAQSSGVPSSFYVGGYEKDGTFVAETNVLGEGELIMQGRRGWLELSSGNFHSMHAAQSPISPYVDGVMTENGFVPSTREVK